MRGRAPDSAFYANCAAMSERGRQAVLTAEVTGYLGEEILKGLEALRRADDPGDEDDLIVGGLQRQGT